MRFNLFGIANLWSWLNEPSIHRQTFNSPSSRSIGTTAEGVDFTFPFKNEPYAQEIGRDTCSRRRIRGLTVTAPHERTRQSTASNTRPSSISGFVPAGMEA
jgi:hypothetical protein